jgi:hypothetical protein
VPVSHRIAAFIVAATLGAPGAAAAQTMTAARGDAKVSTIPPVPLSEGSSENAASDATVPRAVTRTVAGRELPSTGSDPRMLFVCGVALTLLGVGLRLRTADAELY